MTQYVINIGTFPNDGTGDPLRTAFNETNLNFDQVFAAGPVGSNVRIANNTILTTNTNGNLVLAPNGTGVVQANVNIVPNTSNIRNLGSADRRWSTVYLQYANISGNLSVGGNFDVAGDLTVGANLSVTGNIIYIGNLITDAKTIQLANTAGTANAANGSGVTVGANDDIATFLFNSANTAWATNIGLQVGGPITGVSLAVSDATIYGNTNGVDAYFTGTVTTPNIVVNNITSDDSTFVTVADGLNVQGEITAQSISVSGNITGANLVGNVANATYANTAGTAVSIPAGNVTGLATVATTGNYSDLSGVPTNVSSFTNDAGYITTATANVISVNGQSGTVTLTIPTATSNLTNDSGFITSANIPTNVSAFTNDAGYITANVTGAFSATGNITGNYILGNGSQLTDVVQSLVKPNNLLYVAKNGNDATGTGSINAPYQTIQAAIDSAVGDTATTIILAPGNYAEDLTIDNVANSLNITGSGLAESAINGNVVISGTSNNIEFDNLRIVTGRVTHSATGYWSVINSRFSANTGITKTSSSTIKIFNTDLGAAGTGNVLLQGGKTNIYSSQVFNAQVSGASTEVNFLQCDTVIVPTVISGNVNFIDTNIVSSGSGNSLNAIGGYVTLKNCLSITPSRALAPIGFAAGASYSYGDSGFDVGNSTFAGTAIVQAGQFQAVNVRGGNVTTNGLVSATGNVTGGNVVTGGLITATGNVAGGNLISANGVYANVDLIVGDRANASASKGRFVSNSGFMYLQVGNGTPGSTGNIVFSPYQNSTARVTVDTASGNITAVGNVSGGNIITTGNVSGNTAGFAIGYRDIPQVSFTGNATIATTDAGKHFYSTQSSNFILTIANNASQGFQVGAAITVVNQGTGTITIAQGSGVTLYLAGNATSGNRSVSTFGMATIMKVAIDTWFINGTGVS
jgi:hypothetical protein